MREAEMMSVIAELEELSMNAWPPIYWSSLIICRPDDFMKSSGTEKRIRMGIASKKHDR